MKGSHQYPEFLDGLNAARSIVLGQATHEGALAELDYAAEWLQRGQFDVCENCRRPRHEHSMLPPHECDTDSGHPFCDGFFLPEPEDKHYDREGFSE